MADPMLLKAEQVAARLEYSTDEKWWDATKEAPGIIRFLIDAIRELRGEPELPVAPPLPTQSGDPTS